MWNDEEFMRKVVGQKDQSRARQAAEASRHRRPHQPGTLTGFRRKNGVEGRATLRQSVAGTNSAAAAKLSKPTGRAPQPRGKGGGRSGLGAWQGRRYHGSLGASHVEQDRWHRRQLAAGGRRLPGGSHARTRKRREKGQRRDRRGDRSERAKRGRGAGCHCRAPHASKLNRHAAGTRSARGVARAAAHEAGAGVGAAWNRAVAGDLLVDRTALVLGECGALDRIARKLPR